jgi:hypothetical protein
MGHSIVYNGSEFVGQVANLPYRLPHFNAPALERKCLLRNKKHVSLVSTLPRWNANASQGARRLFLPQVSPVVQFAMTNLPPPNGPPTVKKRNFDDQLLRNLPKNHHCQSIDNYCQ